MLNDGLTTHKAFVKPIFRPSVARKQII